MVKGKEPLQKQLMVHGSSRISRADVWKKTQLKKAEAIVHSVVLKQG
jgi:hypothetical protein